MDRTENYKKLLEITKTTEYGKDLFIRKLTTKECFRLQGFLNDQINLEGLSETQKYKLAGNGQSVNVVKLLLEKLIKGVL